MLQSLIIRLDTSEHDSIKLLETMRRYNEACNYVADKAFSLKISNKFQLQKILYRDIRERFGLTAQFAIRIISKVVEAYKRDRQSNRHLENWGQYNMINVIPYINVKFLEFSRNQFPFGINNSCKFDKFETQRSNLNIKIANVFDQLKWSVKEYAYVIRH